MSDSSPTSSTCSYRARYVLPVTGPPRENAVVFVANGRIQSIEDAASVRADTIDLGNVALVPGLVNAHTHLEFSDLATPLGEPGIAFPQWIDLVIQRRAALPPRTPQELVAQAIRPGMEESLRAGVAALGEIATSDWPFTIAELPPLPLVAFRELLGLGAEREAALWQIAGSHLDAQKSFSAERIAGLSPHAPYTVSPGFLELICELSSKRHSPVAMHLAESWEEMELLASHSGPLLEFLTLLGAWRMGAAPRGIAPADYLERLATASRAIVVHGTFLDPSDWRYLADRRERMSVAYCPRTHEHFRRGEYPLAEMLAAGVRVALGTDSRASNPDLSLYGEAKHVARRHPEVAPETILRLATLEGAIALGVEREFGSLEPGKRAEIAVIRLPDLVADPFEAIFDEGSDCVSLASYLSKEGSSRGA